ncbi:MAG: nascent polypeptide-associated complex protein [Candidatus Thermoplasmatota archaeon]|nr:nascent polypeptide-associated complex protein [Candidatus Thermoplasmatota archaeon]
MFGKMNPRQMRQLMKQMGIKMEELDADEVIIKAKGKTIRIEEPEVSVITAQGQKSYQISGKESIEVEEEVEQEPEIKEEDIELVAQQANVSEERAKEALEKTKGDLAEAILQLQQSS